MVALELISEIVFLIAFFYGAIKLWRKGKPLYFQIIVCAIGCFALFHLSVIVMAYCNVNETYFNDSFFGIFGGYMLLLCANRGSLEKVVCERSAPRASAFGIAAGGAMFALSALVGAFCYGVGRFVFYIFVLVQLPACVVLYHNVKHLLLPADELGLLAGLKYTDICSAVLIVSMIFDVACWLNVGIVSGIADLFVSLVVLALSFASVRGAKKWSF